MNNGNSKPPQGTFFIKKKIILLTMTIIFVRF